jgi:hypothetical protein
MPFLSSEGEGSALASLKANSKPSLSAQIVLAGMTFFRSMLLTIFRILQPRRNLFPHG